MNCLKDPDPKVRLNSARCIKNIARHSPDLAEIVVTCGGPAVQIMAARTLGELGRHSTDNAKSLAVAAVPAALLYILLLEDSSDNLKIQTKKSLKYIISMCDYLPALIPLLNDAPKTVLKYVLSQIAQLLPHSLENKKDFLTSGGLKMIQGLIVDKQVLAGSNIRNYIDAINEQYPSEAILYYSPNYEEELISKLEDYD